MLAELFSSSDSEAAEAARPGATAADTARPPASAHRARQARRALGGGDGAHYGAVGIGSQNRCTPGPQGPGRTHQGSDMRTDELIGLLAQDAEPVAQHAIEQRFAVAALAGLAGATVLMLALFGLRPDLAQTLALPMFWGKLLFAAALAGAGWRCCGGWPAPAWAWGIRWRCWPCRRWCCGHWPVMVLGQAAPDERMPLILGSTWRSCPFNIAACPSLHWRRCSGRCGARRPRGWHGPVPGLVCWRALWGPWFYALHCPEMAAPFRRCGTWRAWPCPRRWGHCWGRACCAGRRSGAAACASQSATACTRAAWIISPTFGL